MLYHSEMFVYTATCRTYLDTSMTRPAVREKFSPTVKHAPKVSTAILPYADYVKFRLNKFKKRGVHGCYEL